MIEAKDINGNRTDKPLLEISITKLGDNYITSTKSSNDYIASFSEWKGLPMPNLLMKSCKSLEEAKEFLKELL